MKKLSQTARYMLVSLAALCLLFGALGAAVILLVHPFEPLRVFLPGLVLGCLTSAVRVVMLDRAIDREVDMSEKKAQNYHTLMMIARYGVLVAFVAVLILLKNIFGVFGGVLGILCMQLSAYGGNWLLGRDEKKRKKKAG